MQRKLLILDIDETLLHASEIPLKHLKHDFETTLYYVYKRPFLKEFLDYCQNNFDLAVWTTGGEEFAAMVVEQLFPKENLLKFIWSSKRCTQIFNPDLYEMDAIKNLKKVKKKGYCLENVLMIDNTPSKLRKNYGNLIIINDFIGAQDDKELLLLIKYLEVLKMVDNVRVVEKRGWQKIDNIK